MDLQTIETFVHNTNSGVIVVYGPTACGKTALSIDVAVFLQKIGYSPFVISADSRQIYRYMDIGTGKILQKDQRGIPHIGLDLIDPSERFSVVDYQKNITSSEFWQNFLNPGFFDKKKIVPIVCGGTGLYIDSLIYERNYMGTAPDPKRRQELEDYQRDHGNEALWQLLADIDPSYASDLHPNNTTYIIRAIEVFETTGHSKRESISPLTLRFPMLFITPYNDAERAMLYARIDARVDAMFEDGLLGEIEYTIQNYGSGAPGLHTIGYREVLPYFLGQYSLDEAIALVKQHSRNYAKRQITWNKKYE